jgi:IS1 family transposase
MKTKTISLHEFGRRDEELLADLIRMCLEEKEIHTGSFSYSIEVDYMEDEDGSL